MVFVLRTFTTDLDVLIARKVQIKNTHFGSVIEQSARLLLQPFRSFGHSTLRQFAQQTEVDMRTNNLRGVIAEWLNTSSEVDLVLEGASLPGGEV